jgi:hypothetical protein
LGLLIVGHPLYTTRRRKRKQDLAGAVVVPYTTRRRKRRQDLAATSSDGSIFSFEIVDILRGYIGDSGRLSIIALNRAFAGLTAVVSPIRKLLLGYDTIPRDPRRHGPTVNWFDPDKDYSSWGFPNKSDDLKRRYYMWRKRNMDRFPILSTPYVPPTQFEFRGGILGNYHPSYVMGNFMHLMSDGSPYTGYHDSIASGHGVPSNMLGKSQL